MKQISNFWNWFQNNEEAIKNAFLIGLNTEEVFLNLDKNINYISKRIGYLMTAPSENQPKFIITFTVQGYRKLFPKIIALEDQAPPLKYFIPQAFIKPMQEKEKIKKGNDTHRIYEHYRIKISSLEMALTGYDISRKQISIKVFAPYYTFNKQFKSMDQDLKFIVMQIIGEIAFRKHIKKIEFAQLPLGADGLSPLIDLPDHIDYLYKINSKEKPRRI